MRVELEESLIRGINPIRLQFDDERSLHDIEQSFVIKISYFDDFQEVEVFKDERVLKAGSACTLSFDTSDLEPGPYLLETFRSSQDNSEEECLFHSYHWLSSFKPVPFSEVGGIALEPGENPENFNFYKFDGWIVSSPKNSSGSGKAIATEDIPSAVESAVFRSRHLPHSKIGDHENIKTNHYRAEVYFYPCAISDDQTPIMGGMLHCRSLKYDPQDLTTLMNDFRLARNPELKEVTLVSSDQDRVQRVSSLAHHYVVAEFGQVFAESPDEVEEVLSQSISDLRSVISYSTKSTPDVLGMLIQDAVSEKMMIIGPERRQSQPMKGRFGPSRTATMLRDLGRKEVSDRARSFLSLFADVNAERSDLFRLMKAWTIIEALSKGSVKRSEKVVDQILYRKRPLDCNSDVGRVTEYLMSKALQNTSIKPKPNLSIPQQVLVAYRLRNLIVHEGIGRAQSALNAAEPDSDLAKFIRDAPNRSGKCSRIVIRWAEHALRFEFEDEISF